MAVSEEGFTGFRDSNLERAWDLLVGQYDGHCNRAIYILNARAEASMGSEESDKYRCASLMVLNAGISILNIKKFYRPVGMHTKDVVVLYRVVFESLLNALYVLAAEPDVARRALNHAIQKKYRAHGVSTRLGPFRAHVQTDPLP